jgi:hypothetical protein
MYRMASGTGACISSLPPMSTRPRQTRPIPSKIASSTVRSRQTVKERPSSSATITPTQLLQTLSNSKETTGATVKSLDILIHNLAPEDAQRTAMKAVNATSLAIAAVHKSGWVYTSPADNYTTENVEHTVSAAKLALSALRDRDAASGTERAALGLIGRLMAIKAVSEMSCLRFHITYSLIPSVMVPGI